MLQRGRIHEAEAQGVSIEKIHLVVAGGDGVVQACAFQLHGVALGDVLAEPDQTDDVAASVAHRHFGDLMQLAGAVRELHPLFNSLRYAEREHLLVLPVHLDRPVRRHQVGGTFADDIVFRPVKGPQEGLVD